MNYEFSKFAKEFPSEWKDVVQRIKTNKSLDAPKGKIRIYGMVGGMVRPQNIDVRGLFYLVLRRIDEIIIETESYGYNIAKAQLVNIKRGYENEISSLIGNWSDESLWAIAKMDTDGNAEERFRYLKKLQKSNIASFF